VMPVHVAFSALTLLVGHPAHWHGYLCGVTCRLAYGPAATHSVYTHSHTLPFNGPFSGTTQVSRYQKGKTNLDFTRARDNEWQWHQPGHMQVCTSLHTDNHASTPPLSFLQAGCPSCRPTNSVKALKALALYMLVNIQNV